jgi:hypothetical protein
VVDGLVERPADSWFEAVAGVAQLGGVEDEAAIGPATPDGGIRVPDGLVAAGPDVGERRTNGLPDVGV